MNPDSEDTAAGASASFDFDRMMVQRFRETFPKARWDDERKAWWVPGKTAHDRIARWKALETARADIHADAKGRDAFAFDPIESTYLTAGLELIIRTPYSKTVVDELRQVPFARWDEADRVWRVPYRSYEQLRRRWPAIEAAARRNEPDERKRRQEEAKGSEAFRISRERAAERRRHRFPVPVDAPPPFGSPVSTGTYGIITFTETSGELAEAREVARFYPGLSEGTDLVWANWRSPTLEELVKTWPARNEPSAKERSRGWWQPTKPELVEARKAAKALERRRQKKG